MAFLNAVLAIADPGDELILQTPFYFNHEIGLDRERIEGQRRIEQVAAEAQTKKAREEEKKQQTEAAIAQVERNRRSDLLAQLRQLYILNHDGISSEMLAGTAPLPKKWVEEQLQQRGETWRQDQYY